MRTPAAKKRLLVLATAAALGPACAFAATITVSSVDDAFNSPTCNLRNAINSIRAGAAKGACAPDGTFGVDMLHSSTKSPCFLHTYSRAGTVA